MIYYLMGKSASGKDSIFHKLLERTGWKQLIPYTTRPMREGEIEGQENHFTLFLENGTTVQFYRRKNGKAERILQEQRIMKKGPRRRKI